MDRRSHPGLRLNDRVASGFDPLQTLAATFETCSVDVRAAHLNGEFISQMARHKIESFVESMRIDTSFVGRKLHVTAPTATALRDGPFDHFFAYPTAAP